MIELPNKEYKIIYADPAWRYNARNNLKTKFGGGAMGHYPTMTTNEICSLPIQNIAADDCVLFLWATGPKIPDALQVIEAWGFEYVTIGFTWMKMNKLNSNLFFGTGNYTKHNSEFCILAKKGTPIKMKISDKVSSAILTHKESHSQKPAEVRDRIVQLFGNVPRIELFARDRVDGWDAWGNQLPIEKI